MRAEVTQSDLRERILNEAARLFTQLGYQGISMREIAEAVGVSKAGLYYHFKNKEALFLGVLLSYIGRLGQLVAEVRVLKGFRAQLKALFIGIATQMAGQQKIMRLAEQDAVHLSTEAQREMYRAYYAVFIGQIQEMIEAAQESGEIKALESKSLTRVLLGMAYPLLSTPPYDSEATVELMLEVFFEGVAKS